MKKVRVGDLRLGKEEEEAILEVVRSNRISESTKVYQFENVWADFVGTKHCVLVNSGTSALIAGLLALKHKYNLADNTNVITSPVTYISTVNAITLAGFNPVFVDLNREDFTMSVSSLESLLKNSNPEDYSVVLPVHLMGYVNDMDAIKKIAWDHGLFVFEDSAEAHGSIYKGKKAGSLSDISAFSFYIAHNIQAGEMGAVNTNDNDLATLVKKIKSNGRVCDCRVCVRDKGKCVHYDDASDPRFTHDIIGYNFKAMDFQAAIALSQLRKIEHILSARRDNVKYLNDGLEKFSKILQLPKYSSDVSYLAYPILIKDEKISREKLCSDLESKGVETRPLFGCIPTQQPAYAHLREKYLGKIPNAEFIGGRGFYIGCHQYLEKNDLDHIIKSFEEVLK
ncbi:MAG: DegT/DnrJ/EryC1/StrS family aminotransferase [Candidatus Nanoarchaeia archaeon]